MKLHVAITPMNSHEQSTVRLLIIIKLLCGTPRCILEGNNKLMIYFWFNVFYVYLNLLCMFISVDCDLLCMFILVDNCTSKGTYN